MLRSLSRIGLGLFLVAGLAQNAAAQVVQSFDVSAGAFSPRGNDTRDANDVVLKNEASLVLKPSDLTALDFRGEWNLTFGQHIEAGFSAGYFQGHAHPFNAAYVDSSHNNSNIYQDDRMRVIPIEAVVRFMPFGKTGTFQPYVGAGVAILPWRYSEEGSFVGSDLSIFQGRYVSTGTATGPVLLGGAKMPVGGDIYAFTIEARYQHGIGKLDPSQGFAGSTIDLSGISTQFGFLVRF